MYRLYIDETGNADLNASRDPNHRYLSLTGVVMHMDHVRAVVIPQLDQIKTEVLNHDPDSPIILHRKEILQRKPPFHPLKDDGLAARFDAALLRWLGECDYCAITVVIDKLEHLNRYQVWRYEPYHYCLEVLLERYVHHLRVRGAQGDVMAEVRGGKSDYRLEKTFSRLYKRGTTHIPAGTVQGVLTSSRLKLKPKRANVAGLQLADCLAHPSALYVRSQYAGDVNPRGFGQQVIDLLVQDKYRRRGQRQIVGYGTKWLP